MRPLTAKERVFVDEITKPGTTQADAWRVAYPKQASELAGDNRGIAEEARVVARRPQVAAAIEAHRKKQEARSEWTKAQAIERLRQIANEPAPGHATHAIAQASKMLGWDAPLKVEAKIEGSLLHQIRNRVRSRRA